MMNVARWLLAVVLISNFSTPVLSQTATLTQRVEAIMSRPEFTHSHFGIEIYSLDKKAVIYKLNPDKLMVPGSTTKLLTEGTVLESLGGDYRFHTRVYHTGNLKNGVLDGDIILVASGDPNLSGRIQPDGSLAYENMDHSYGGPDSTGLGDPLLVIRQLAQQVADKGIRKIKGKVLVDVSLFPEGDRELGTNVVISPIVVNDNVLDVIATGGDKEGAPVSLQVAPKTAYLQVINQATTGKPGSKTNLTYTNEKANPDGTRSVTLTGSLPPGKNSGMMSYAVPEPSRFAANVLADALKEKGIDAAVGSTSSPPDFKLLAASYKPGNLLAEHVSPPLKEDVKITLKVSQNLHASMGPFLLGALVAHKNTEIDQAGFDVEHDFLKKAGLDLNAAAQADGAGGNAFFTADFVVRYLAFMSTQKDFGDFERGLPILGRDGTLFKIQTNSPAAGHVRAKTGTNAVYNALNKNLMVTGKGLAGYIDTVGGEHLAIAAYVNMVTAPRDDLEAIQKIAGEALGEIASAAYEESASPVATSAAEPTYDVLIRNGRIIDGTGNPWVSGDVAIRGERISAIGDLKSAQAKRVIDAKGLVVAPGFIDMLGQSEYSLLIDNRSLSKLSQGITTEITGEGASIAPQNEKTIAELQPGLDQYPLKVDWTSLDEYFVRLEKTGTPLNIGTYLGAAQIRQAVLGDDNRPPSPEELERMKTLVRETMEQGAFGISSALIYPPGQYAKTEELIELAKVVSSYGGIYASHMRSEGQSEAAAIEEALRIGREAHVPVEIFHLKVIGKPRWGTMPKMVAMIQAARDAGQDVSADMYPYVAGGTALASSLPPWVAEGGTEKLLERLKSDANRARIQQEMATEHPDWENLYLGSGGASGVLVSGIVNPELKQYDGKTLAQIATAQHKAPLDALFDLVLADKARTGALYFIASESDLHYGLKQPWTSIGLDASELSLDGPLFEPQSHPRAFGSMPRFLGHYVRDEHLLPLEQAIRKITSLPAQRERLRDRGLLKAGYYADVTIFDSATISDNATYEKPTRLSQGVKYVFVNGQLEYEQGRLTGVKAGSILRGPGWKAATKANTATR
jgi:N-acyl-D-amino-acid deacylase